MDNLELDDEIVDRYLAGATMEEVSTATAASLDRVRRVLNERGIPFRSGAAHRIPLPAAELADLYQDGLTIAQLAERYHVSTNTVYSRLRELGVSMRPRGPQPGWYERRRLTD